MIVTSVKCGACDGKGENREIEETILDRKTPHKGKGVKRVLHNPRELAFSEQWEKENTGSWGQSGELLDLLFTEYNDKWPFGGIRMFYISRKEKMIAATIIQWLGSNVGMCFLRESLKKCGYRISKIDNNGAGNV